MVLNTAKRYIYFFIGLFINSLGVAMITLADLGTSPISSIPYVLSLKYTPTIGEFTMLFSIMLIVIQILLLRKDYPRIQLLQIPVSILFGYFIDFSMDHILFWMNPQNYPAKFIFLLIGCGVLGFGVFMEVSANALMLPGEGVVNAIHLKFNKEFGTVKVCVDVSMCICAIVLSLVLKHQISGVREGTVIAALLVGFLSRGYSRLLLPSVSKLLSPKDYAGADAAFAK